MAGRTLVELRDEAGRPNMVAATEVEAYVRFVGVMGPYKVETLLFQQAAANDFIVNDVINSQLAHPLWVSFTPVSDLDGTALIGSAELTSDESDANYKQITIRDCEDLNGIGIMLQVFGF